ncbi:hypothetical protein GCM10023185_09300 [Hymenobacter saemangeumensis]|uniref:Secretion system C-terminal sorting domain-containing protein n=1 Tax=Hymenobacter saemangeumensis TaxID=1084522 RepID=A0ABP8I4M2_9BACT
MPGAASLAQVLDPAFHIPEIYGAASISDAAQMPNGQFVVAGRFTRTNGQPGKGLARFDAAGVEDPGFRQSLSGARIVAEQLQPLANGQLLVVGDYLAGSVQRQFVFRLNADGSLDPSFNLVLPAAGTFPQVRQAIAQPDGQVLILGVYLRSNNHDFELFRVQSDGSPDPSFNVSLSSSSVVKMLLQPDGKIVLAGGISNVNGVFHGSGVVRLTSSGSTDAGFQSGLSVAANNNTTPYITSLALDANGALLVGGRFAAQQPVLRLLPTGALDPGLSTVASLPGRTGQQVAVLSNGQIMALLVPHTSAGGLLPFTSQLVKLQADGSVDATFQQGSGPNGFLYGVRPLAGGSFLTWGAISNFAGQRRTVALVQNGGGLDAGFAPLLQRPASVSKVVRQADGKLLIAGRFNSIDGHLTDYLARLLPSGQLDRTFAWRQSTNADWYPSALAVQADGRVLVAASGAVNPFRLNTDGTADAGFAPMLAPGSNGTGGITLLTALANGQILVGGRFADAAGKPNLTRLNADGSVEATFAPAANQPVVVSGMVEASGNIIAVVSSGGSNPYQNRIARLLPNGVPDPSFTYVNTAGNGPDHYGPHVIAPGAAAGGYVAGGIFTDTRVMAAITATGGAVPGFASPFLPIITPTNLESGINALAVQSDGRIVVGGYMRQGSQAGTPSNLLARLEANGQLDATFNANTLSTGPGSAALPGYNELSQVNDVLVQPDGAIVAGGYFLEAAGQPVTGLVRFLARGALGGKQGNSSQAGLHVWPNPAHGVLHLRLEAKAQPQRVTLFDAVGKAVLAQPATTDELTLSTATLAPGLYVLRVDYAGGPVTRRVAIE